MANPYAEGASQSLNKTISEIMHYLKDHGARPNTGLRVFMREKIADLGERWYRKGFNRGHRQSRKEFRNDGKVPKILRYKCARQLAPGQRRSIKLKSTAP